MPVEGGLREADPVGDRARGEPRQPPLVHDGQGAGEDAWRAGLEPAGASGSPFTTDLLVTWAS